MSDATKDWCMDAANREDGCEVGAGALGAEQPLVKLRLELTKAQKALEAKDAEIKTLEAENAEYLRNGGKMLDKIARLEEELNTVLQENERADKDHLAIEADNERLRAAATKANKELSEMDVDHSCCCWNWSFLENSQHQCGLCDLRDALNFNEEK